MKQNTRPSLPDLQWPACGEHQRWFARRLQESGWPPSVAIEPRLAFFRKRIFGQHVDPAGLPGIELSPEAQVEKLDISEFKGDERSSVDTSESGSQRKSIQSVEIGARVLLALLKADSGGAFLRDVASNSGLSRSQAHRYLLAFINTGMVEQNASSGRYSLGTLAVRLGLAAMARLDPVRIATGYLEELLDELKTTGLLSVWGDNGPTVIRWIDGGVPLFTSMHVGSNLPLQGSSTGTLFLAYCPPAQTRERVERERAEGIVVDDEELSDQIESVRKLGYARTYGSVVPGLAAVSVPIFDSQHRLVATMSVLARAQDKAYFSKAKIERILEQARRASEAIGWPGQA